jgi:hypothetical protein
VVRNTSLRTYQQIKDEGLLTKYNWHTYDLVFRHGPLTANQMMQKAKDEDPTMTHQALENIGRRLSDLRDQGALTEVAEVDCPITGRPCILWDVTDALPVKPERKVDTPEGQVAKIEAIDANIAKLQARREKELHKLRLMVQDHCPTCKSLDVSAFDPVLSYCNPCNKPYERQV